MGREEDAVQLEGLLLDELARAVRTDEKDAQLLSILTELSLDCETTDYDNWDGGTYTYRCTLTCARPPQVQMLESERDWIDQTLSHVLDDYSGWLGELRIQASLDANWRTQDSSVQRRLGVLVPGGNAVPSDVLDLSLIHI